MANFSYKLTTQKSMKIAGVIDTDEMIVELNGESFRTSHDWTTKEYFYRR